MNIAINARASFGSRKSGIGVYVENLVLALSTIDHENRYFIISDVPSSHPDGHQPNSEPGSNSKGESEYESLPENIQFIHIPPQPGYYRAVWDQLGLPVLLRRESIDIVLCPKFVVPFNRPSSCKAVVTIHDLLYLRYPDLFLPATRRYWRLMVPMSVKYADHVIVPSTEVRDDVVSNFKLPTTKITVIPHGMARIRFGFDASSQEPLCTSLQNGAFDGTKSAAERATNARPPAVLERYGIHKPFILTVGTIEPRKNLLRLVEAVHILHEAGYAWPLVMVGQAGWGSQVLDGEIERLGMSGKVVQTGFVEDRDLYALYREASVFCYPSIGEGFGLPVAEAVAMGLPVIASKTLPLPEEIKSACILVSPEDSTGIADGIRSIMEDPGTRERLRKIGRDLVQTFNWYETARRHLDVFQILCED